VHAQVREDQMQQARVARPLASAGVTEGGRGVCGGDWVERLPI